MATPEKDLLFTFQVHQDGAADFKVVRFEGEEALSRLYRFEVILVCDAVDVDMEAMLQATATLRLWKRDRSSSVAYHGMLAEFEQAGQVDQYAFYRAVLVPRLWRLGLNRLNEVYLTERTIPDLITHILQENGLGDEPALRKRLREPSVSYRERSFVCQYQETDFDFISRWMEEEGLYYYFDQGDADSTSETMVLTDYREGQPADGPELRYTPPENVQTDRQDHCVTALLHRKTHVPANALVQDFNYRKASMGDDLRGEHAVRGGLQSARGRQSVYMVYGGNLREESEALRLSRVRAEELGCQADVFTGEATAIGLRAGYPLTVRAHFRDSLNSTYLVTRVRHEGSQTGVVLSGQTTAYQDGEQGSRYQCSFSALSHTMQFRAASITPRPRICGYLSAIIDGEGEGDVAEINEYGQYKVQLLYDYSAKSANKGSSWLRMATPYAGVHEGMHFPLLKGTEVLIGFADGDPDQPIILSAVPNSVNASIVATSNATSNAIRTHQGNVLNMRDQANRVGITMYSPTASSVIFIGSYPTP